MNAEVVSKISSELGEGPLYHQGNFYWVDIIGKKINKLGPNGEESCLYEGEKAPTSIVPGSKGELFLTLEDGFYKLTESGLEGVGSFKIHDSLVRFNDGKCDSNGNYWAGTMDRAEIKFKGSMYVLKPDYSIVNILAGVCVSNGLCWNEDMTTFYYIDSPSRKIKAYDFDPVNLILSNKRSIYQLEDGNVFPDGMTIDMEGNLWLALWNGYSVICVNPETHSVVQKIDVPCAKVTSCCFGGEVFDELYITTSSKDMTEADWQKYPDSGKVFKVKPGVLGFPADKFGG